MRTIMGPSTTSTHAVATARRRAAKATERQSIQNEGFQLCGRMFVPIFPGLVLSDRYLFSCRPTHAGPEKQHSSHLGEQLETCSAWPKRLLQTDRTDALAPDLGYF